MLHINETIDVFCKEVNHIELEVLNMLEQTCMYTGETQQDGDFLGRYLLVSFGIFWKFSKDTKRYQKIPGIFWYLWKISKRYQVSFSIFWKFSKDTKRYLVSFGIFWYLFNRFKRYQKIPQDITRYHMIPHDVTKSCFLKQISAKPFGEIRVLIPRLALDPDFLFVFWSC